MICPGCWRDVPDLVGPDEDLCPECHGLDPDNLIPSLLGCPGSGEWPEDLVPDLPEKLWNQLAEEDGNLFPHSSLDPLFPAAPLAPLFRGRPRF